MTTKQYGISAEAVENVKKYVNMEYDKIKKIVDTVIMNDTVPLIKSYMKGNQTHKVKKFEDSYIYWIDRGYMIDAQLSKTDEFLFNEESFGYINPPRIVDDTTYRGEVTRFMLWNNGNNEYTIGEIDKGIITDIRNFAVKKDVIFIKFDCVIDYESHPMYELNTGPLFVKPHDGKFPEVIHMNDDGQFELKRLLFSRPGNEEIFKNLNENGWDITQYQMKKGNVYLPISLDTTSDEEQIEIIKKELFEGAVIGKGSTVYLDKIYPLFLIKPSFEYYIIDKNGDKHRISEEAYPFAKKYCEEKGRFPTYKEYEEHLKVQKTKYEQSAKTRSTDDAQKLSAIQKSKRLTSKINKIYNKNRSHLSIVE